VAESLSISALFRTEGERPTDSLVIADPGSCGIWAAMTNLLETLPQSIIEFLSILLMSISCAPVQGHNTTNATHFADKGKWARKIAGVIAVPLKACLTFSPHRRLIRIEDEMLDDDAL
jgi:hypothetical protein